MLGAINATFPQDTTQHYNISAVARAGLRSEELRAIVGTEENDSTIRFYTNTNKTGQSVTTAAPERAKDTDMGSAGPKTRIDKLVGDHAAARSRRVKRQLTPASCSR
ncbi:hypothetical protein DPM13_12775 [Paracoccus mutanolyticus]|uniref:Tyr recombinase domain-containing protein n=1 Tax=Paracoccus mutanolyticus TaxID=1499308 RepID=A0ABM6WT37_9RHOB|nr:hypothetical protein [Paracoccus mutanolyticus]AWX93655.1 hypothetical protein DPM13_12775 [Paracoccus mutanolyticus]